MKRYLFTLPILVVIILSFILYSFNYFAALNSDCAIQILITYYFKLPGDLYYWGQDRWGSLIPLIGQIFYKGLHLSPITAVSITYYLLLISGYIGFTNVFKTNFSKVIAAIILFLPPLRFVDVLWYPIGIQYSLLGISLLILKYINFSERKVKNYFLLFMLSIVYIGSQWVSDAAFITIFILVSIHALLYWKQSKIKLTILFYSMCTLVVGYFFIRYGKENAISRTDNYLGLNNIHNIIESISKIGEAIRGLLLFQRSETLMSVYTYLSLILIALLIFYAIKRGMSWDLKGNRWIYFFLIDGLIAICIALTSKWVYLNDVNRRYFFGSYLSLSFAFLLILEQIKLFKYEKELFRIALYMTVLIGAMSTPYYFKYVWLKSLTPQVKIYSDITKLGPAGIIGEYWHSYITACADPSMIVATPKDDDLVRNPQMVERVFTQPNIYIIRNDWMDVFPDTLQQFGRTLFKNGEEFYLSGCNICKYKTM
jgi:hypothetical protein